MKSLFMHNQDKSRQMTPCRLVLGSKARLEENLLGKGARLQVRATIYTSNVILRLHTLTPKSMPVPNAARIVRAVEHVGCFSTKCNKKLIVRRARRPETR